MDIVDHILNILKIVLFILITLYVINYYLMTYGIIDNMIYFFKYYVFAVCLLIIITLSFLFLGLFFKQDFKTIAEIKIFSDAIDFFCSRIPYWTQTLFVIVFLLFLLVYVVYLIIITIIPETGIVTLFIPVRELLLAIPPIPDFKSRGVFDVFDKVFAFIGFSNEGFQNKCNSYLSFCKEDFYKIIKIFNPDLNIEKFANMVENKDNQNAKIASAQNNIEVCIGSDSKFTPPNSSYVTMVKNNIANMKNKVKCNLDAIPAYVTSGE
jgi:hypothetical protein